MNSTTFEHLSKLAALMTEEQYLEELSPRQVQAVKDTADIVMANIECPLTADTIYAMNFGALLDRETSPSPPIASMFGAMMGTPTQGPSTQFMLMIAELARRVLAGEIEAPEAPA